MSYWFDEKFEQENLNSGQRTSIEVEKVLYKGKSDFQEIEIVETTKFGRMMLLDGIIMLYDKYEYCYHEMIAHVPLFAHPNPERVLVIGGGDGGTAREVIKHDKVKECVMVEIDGLVVEKSKEYFPKIAEGFSNPKLTLLIDDGIKYIKENVGSFDVVIIDSTDPIGPAEGLFTEEFYKEVFNTLKDDGICVAQAENPFFYPEIQKEYFGMLKRVFPYVSMYLSNIPFYPSGTWSLSFASKKYTENDNPRFEDMRKMESELNYFNEDIYKASFALPNFAKKVML